MNPTDELIELGEWPAAVSSDQHVPLRHSRSTKLPEAGICIAVLMLALCFPVVAIVALNAFALWRCEYRPVLYNQDVPSVSKYVRTLKPPGRDLDPEEICAHCRDEFFQPLELSCGHVFCTNCIRSLVEYRHTTCPLCYRRQFTLVEQQAARFVCLGLVSTAVAIVVQVTAMFVGFFHPSGFNVNPTPLWTFLNIGEMTGALLTPAIMEMTYGDEWLAIVPFRVAVTFVLLAYTTFVAGYTTILLQLKFWKWSLLGVPIRLLAR